MCCYAVKTTVDLNDFLYQFAVVNLRTNIFHFSFNPWIQHSPSPVTLPFSSPSITIHSVPLPCVFVCSGMQLWGAPAKSFSQKQKHYSPLPDLHPLFHFLLSLILGLVVVIHWRGDLDVWRHFCQKRNRCPTIKQTMTRLLIQVFWTLCYNTFVHYAVHRSYKSNGR